MHPSRYLFFACLGFVGGVFAGSALFVPDAALLVGFTVAAACFVYAIRQKKFLVFAFALGAVVLGAVLYGDAKSAWQQQRTAFFSLAKERAALTATVISRERTANAQRYTLEHVVSENIGQKLPPDFRMQLLYTSAHAFSPGDRMVVRGARFDTSDEFVPLLKRDSVAGSLAFPKEIVFLENPCVGHRFSTPCLPYTLRAVLIYTRESFEQSLRKTLSEPHASLAGGLLLGARTGLPTDIKESFRYLGLSHIVAVSGYNITIVVLAVSTLLGFFMVSRRASFWFATIFLILFTLLTGASASVVRAAVMGFLVIVAQHASRMYNAKIAIVLAGALMLVQNPFLLRHDIGFLLSFLATAGLLTLYPLLEEHCERLPKFGPVKNVVLQSLSAQAFVLPVLIVAFGAVPLLFLVSNILILPTIPPAMLFSFLGGVAGFFGDTLGRIIAFPAHTVLAWELGVVGLLAKIPHAQATFVSPLLRWVFGMGAGAAVCWLTWKLHTRRCSRLFEMR